MSKFKTDLLNLVQVWLDSEANIQSAVLFGSAVHIVKANKVCDRWTDLDLHIVANDIDKVKVIDCIAAFKPQKIIVRALRPATGGMQKLTLLLSSGQIDLVLVPSSVMASAREAFDSGVHRTSGMLKDALNEMATCLATGHLFLKGEDKWGDFYASVVREMPGVRVDNETLQSTAEVFLCDLFWVLQKLRKGEVIAAQHILHRSLSETNLRMMREFRLRNNLALPSFGLGRHAEKLLSSSEIDVLSLSAPLSRETIKSAANHAFFGMKTLMSQLVPDWKVPAGFESLLREID